jgi:hypothetical protein
LGYPFLFGTFYPIGAAAECLLFLTIFSACGGGILAVVRYRVKRCDKNFWATLRISFSSRNFQCFLPCFLTGGELKFHRFLAATDSERGNRE